ncbi:MAG TPA: hypothetical protein VJO35_18765 [Terriglobales bacterium]|nr:hypothetical protein [Terriglobales bacterium]
MKKRAADSKKLKIEESNDPEILRAEVRRIIAEIDDRDILAFLLWTFKRILKNQPLPPLDEIPSLCDAFLRVMNAIRTGTKARKADLDLVDSWMRDQGLPN